MDEIYYIKNLLLLFAVIIVSFQISLYLLPMTLIKNAKPKILFRDKTIRNLSWSEYKDINIFLSITICLVLFQLPYYNLKYAIFYLCISGIFILGITADLTMIKARKHFALEVVLVSCVSTLVPFQLSIPCLGKITNYYSMLSTYCTSISWYLFVVYYIRSIKTKKLFTQFITVFSVISGLIAYFIGNNDIAHLCFIMLGTVLSVIILDLTKKNAINIGNAATGVIGFLIGFIAITLHNQVQYKCFFSLNYSWVLFLLFIIPTCKLLYIQYSRIRI